MQEEPDYTNSTPDGALQSARALLASYAMGVVTAEEAREVEAAVAAHPELAQELIDYRHLAEAMVIETPPMEPPPGALDALLRVAAGTDTRQMEPPPAAPRRLRDILFEPRWRFSPAFIAASLVVLFGIVGLLAYQLSDLEGEYLQLVHEHEYDAQALEVMRAQDVRWIQMTSPQQTQQPFAWLVYSPGFQSGVILANSFPQLPRGQVYQVWALRGDEDERVGIFEVDPSGSAAYVFELPDEIDNYDQLTISVEPEGGSDWQTSPSIVNLDLERFH